MVNPLRKKYDRRSFRSVKRNLNSEFKSEAIKRRKTTNAPSDVKAAIKLEIPKAPASIRVNKVDRLPEDNKVIVSKAKTVHRKARFNSNKMLTDMLCPNFYIEKEAINPRCYQNTRSGTTPADYAQINAVLSNIQTLMNSQSMYTFQLLPFTHPTTNPMGCTQSVSEMITQCNTSNPFVNALSNFQGPDGQFDTSASSIHKNLDRKFVFNGGKWKIRLQNINNYRCSITFWEHTPRRPRTHADDKLPVQCSVESKKMTAPYISWGAGSNFAPTGYSTTTPVGTDCDDPTDLGFTISANDEITQFHYMTSKPKVFTLNTGDWLEYEVDLPPFTLMDTLFQSLSTGDVGIIPMFTKYVTMRVKGLPQSTRTTTATNASDQILNQCEATGTNLTVMTSFKYSFRSIPTYRTWNKSYTNKVNKSIPSVTYVYASAEEPNGIVLNEPIANDVTGKDSEATVPQHN